MELPKYNKSRITGERGLTILKEIVESKLGWILRVNHQEHDFGIDGYLDIVTSKNEVTGKSIAFQLKTGNSFFKEQNELGFVFRGERKHLNYYLNLDHPIIIILVDIENKKAFWEVFKIDNTDQAGNNWKITIPKKNEISENSSEELLNHVTGVTDYISQIEQNWEFNNKLKDETSLLLLRIPKEDIMNLNYDPILSMLKRMLSTTELTIKMKGRLDISFDHYEEDERELHEIPEVKKWLNGIYGLTNCWPYIVGFDPHQSFMKVLFFSMIPILEKRYDGMGGMQIDFNPRDAKEFFEVLFGKLNSFCSENGLSMEINKEISANINKYYFGI